MIQALGCGGYDGLSAVIAWIQVAGMVGDPVQETHVLEEPGQLSDSFADVGCGIGERADRATVDVRMRSRFGDTGSHLLQGHGNDGGQLIEVPGHSVEWRDTVGQRRVGKVAVQVVDF